MFIDKVRAKIVIKGGTVQEAEDIRYSSTHVSGGGTVNRGQGTVSVGSTVQHHQVQKIYFVDQQGKQDWAQITYTNVAVKKGDKIKLIYGKKDDNLYYFINQSLGQYWARHTVDGCILSSAWSKNRCYGWNALFVALPIAFFFSLPYVRIANVLRSRSLYKKKFVHIWDFHKLEFAISLILMLLGVIFFGLQFFPKNDYIAYIVKWLGTSDFSAYSQKKLESLSFLEFFHLVKYQLAFLLIPTFVLNYVYSIKFNFTMAQVATALHTIALQELEN
ncbi:MAG: hypothetical protein KDK39_05740 [Leptospiraceae bacterium]|nr:hypothetical protein [Leptospiraceae bacterium]